MPEFQWYGASCDYSLTFKNFQGLCVSNTDTTNVYTIYAGMIPTLGFANVGDFTVE